MEIIKRIVESFVALFVCTLVMSCSDMDNNKEPMVTKNEVGIKEDLADLNLRILKNVIRTRGEKPEQQKKDTVKVSVVDADIYGCIAGGTAGLFVKTPDPRVKAACAFVGALIGGAVASITAAAQSQYVVFGSAKSSKKNLANVLKFSNTMAQLSMIDSCMVDSFCSHADLEIPAKYAKALKVGIMHNMMLDNYKKNAIVTEFNAMNVPFSELQTCKEFQLCYQSIIDGSLKWKEETKSEELDNVALVANSFASIYNDFVADNDKQNALNVIQAYIHFIDKRDDLDMREKEGLVEALSVAWYSFNYWTASWHEKSEKSKS